MIARRSRDCSPNASNVKADICRFPALFFAELKFTDFRIGLFMTLTLLGDVFLGIFLTMIADRVGRRKVLFAGSGLMIVSGIVFSYFENFWVLLLAAIVGQYILAIQKD